jgi:RNA polymerase sigma factor (TIGR02999 family)
MSASDPQPDNANAITLYLKRLRLRDPDAERKVADLLYPELHRLARRYMKRERPGHTLQPTELLNEAYLELIDQDARDWANRAHFIATAAQAMRRILIDYARARLARKRGGDSVRIELSDNIASAVRRSESFFALEQALDRLASQSPELARIVEMRYFGGLTDEEIAEAMGISARTIKRRWQVARRWLELYLNGASKVRTTAETGPPPA